MGSGDMQMSSFNRRILIVDDNADIHNDFRKILGNTGKRSQANLSSIEQQLFAGDPEPDDEPELTAAIEYNLDFAFQGEDAVRMVVDSLEKDEPYALVFMDVRMPPGIDGIETIKRIWQRHDHIEVVICTAFSDYSFDGILDKLGRSDRLLFLTKPFDSIAVKQMAQSLTHKWNLAETKRQNVARLEAEIAQRKASEARLQHMINHDELTGLANRNRLATALEEHISRAREEARRFALFFIELERFDEVIDTLGYQIGDKLFIEIADRLRTRFNEHGELFRLDEAELAILVPSMTSVAQTTTIAESLRKSFETSFDLGELSIDVSSRIGIVIYPDHGTSGDMLMRYADMTLIHARRTEKGFSYFEESMNHFSPQRLTLLSELRNAISADELMIYYQPKLCLHANAIHGVEALLRWPHPRLGFISPGHFIPLAERCGLMKPLTSWVLKQTTAQWRHWHEEGLNLVVSVNLTVPDIQDNGLPDRIAGLLGAVGMPPDRLCIEINELTIMKDPEQAVAVLGRIRDLGVRVSIDNFGKGYSSLAYLKKLPISRIKIDHSFVTNMVGNDSDIAIVKSMIDLGHNLGFRVVAEGVDQVGSFELLRSLGCDFIQGNLISTPIPSGELMLWFSRASWPVARAGKTA